MPVLGGQIVSSATGGGGGSSSSSHGWGISFITGWLPGRFSLRHGGAGRALPPAGIRRGWGGPCRPLLIISTRTFGRVAAKARNPGLGRLDHFHRYVVPVQPQLEQGGRQWRPPRNARGFQSILAFLSPPYLPRLPRLISSTSTSISSASTAASSWITTVSPSGFLRFLGFWNWGASFPPGAPQPCRASFCPFCRLSRPHGPEKLVGVGVVGHAAYRPGI